MASLDAPPARVASCAGITRGARAGTPSPVPFIVMAARRHARHILLGAALGTIVATSSASGQFLTVYGGPAEDTTQNHFLHGGSLATADARAGSGIAVSTGQKVSGGNNLGLRAIRWDATGAATELGNLGSSSTGETVSRAYAVNAAGVAVGYAGKYAAATSTGTRPVRWNATGTAATELGHLGVSVSGFTEGSALAINAAGTAVGFANKFVNGDWRGERPVRWSASSSVAAELGVISMSGNFTHSHATAINAAGTAVGWGNKYSGATPLGQRAVRWSASSPAATELGTLEVGAGGGVYYSAAYAINDAGSAVGQADKWAGSTNLGRRAVRWDASGTVATELGGLGTGLNVAVTSSALAINNAGDAVGAAMKYDTSGFPVRDRAVRWNAGGTTATELGLLGADAGERTVSLARAINDAGYAVGYERKLAGTSGLDGYTDTAVVWRPDGSAIDLNSLIAPNSGWALMEARSISNRNWVAGVGLYSDGAGAFSRAFLLDISSVVVPEPASMSMAAAALLGGWGLCWRRVHGRGLVRAPA
jgi:hypothetical protein